MSTAGEEQSKQSGMFEKFFGSEVSGSVVLLFFTIVALVWANSPWSEQYFELIHTYISVSWGDAVFKLSLGHWVGDGLMAIFFFVVGLEIKREFVVGQLSTRKQAILPITAALGGAVTPAILYSIFNFGTEASSGWGIPMATDIAFALGVLSLFGKRVPIALKVFLTALAIADDLMAVVVIAVFYTEQISVFALLMAGLFMFLIVVAGRMGIRQNWIYVTLAILTWGFVLTSGVHATIAGVLLALLIPVKAVIDPQIFLARARGALSELEVGDLTKTSPVRNHQQLKALDDMYVAVADMRPPGISLEHQLHPVQSFLILPLFALFKAGVPITEESLHAFQEPLGIGIVLGLILGKQIGITLASLAVIRFGWGGMPEGVTWGQLWGASCLAGIGFTMSIFISELAFSDHLLVEEAKISILAASLLAGILGFIVLGRTLPKQAP